MPRSNRPRRRAAGDEAPELDLERALLGRSRTVSKRDGLWNVQPHASGAATKVYTCPGCGLEIVPGTAHLVAWRADGIMGEADDLAGRRHWHTHCWRIRT
jgi:hypothetical protein